MPGLPYRLLFVNLSHQDRAEKLEANVAAIAERHEPLKRRFDALEKDAHGATQQTVKLMEQLRKYLLSVICPLLTTFGQVG